jgi:hypothetical protein
MKRSVKANTKRGATRDLFAELSEGMEALSYEREGKRTLRTHSTEIKPAAEALAQKPFEEIVEPIARSFDESGMSESELDELITETKRAVRRERRRDK